MISLISVEERLGPYVGDKEEEVAGNQLRCALADEIVPGLALGSLASAHYMVAPLFWMGMITLADMFGLCINPEPCVIEPLVVPR